MRFLRSRRVSNSTKTYESLLRDHDETLRSLDHLRKLYTVCQNLQSTQGTYYNKERLDAHRKYDTLLSKHTELEHRLRKAYEDNLGWNRSYAQKVEENRSLFETVKTFRKTIHEQNREIQRLKVQQGDPLGRNNTRDTSRAGTSRKNNTPNSEATSGQTYVPKSKYNKQRRGTWHPPGYAPNESVNNSANKTRRRNTSQWNNLRRVLEPQRPRAWILLNELSPNGKEELIPYLRRFFEARNEKKLSKAFHSALLAMRWHPNHRQSYKSDNILPNKTKDTQILMAAVNELKKNLLEGL